MASYKLDPAKGSARIYWRFRGRQMTKVLRGSERDAQRACDKVDDTIRDVERGAIAIPEGADPRDFLFSGGKVGAARAEVPRVATLQALIAAYEASPPPHLEGSTRKMVRVHFNRLLESAPTPDLARFDRGAAQRYVAARTAKLYRGRPIGRDTVEKELKTLRHAWQWVAGQGGGTPRLGWALKDLSFPKRAATRNFMTWSEVEREVGRGGLSEAEVGDLWDCLWLDRGQVRALLEFVRGADVAPFLHPMIVAAAFTGARRSELCRSRVGDWNLPDAKVQVRQKKRDKEVEFTLRSVDLHPDAVATFRAWFDAHPGGVHAFANPDGSEVTWDAATHHFKAALAGSRWEVVKGWHVLRHSFASNLAAAGVDQRIIDEYMGHSTEVRKRYLHLRPDLKRDAIRAL